jgi:hypothetical protein
MNSAAVSMKNIGLMLLGFSYKRLVTHGTSLYNKRDRKLNARKIHYAF